MRIPAASLTLVSAFCCSVAAHAAAPTSGNAACPVSLDVRHSSASYTQAIGSDHGVVTPSTQVLELTVHNDAAAGVASIRSTLQMRSDQVHTQSLQPDSQTVQPAGERILLELIHLVNADRDVLRVRTIPNRNPVEYIEVNQVTFVDGSRWTAPSSASCRFAPNPVALIAAR